jgi:hypothetical protein
MMTRVLTGEMNDDTCTHKECCLMTHVLTGGNG